MSRFILIIQFLTRIPININIDFKEGDLPKGIIYFPIVGLIIGIFNVLIYFIASKIAGGLFPLIASITANIIITGGLHVDGLADTCDGIYSSRKKDKMLEIMRDSRVGTNGVIAIFLDLALRITLLANLNGSYILKAIVISPVMGRIMLALLAFKSNYARNDSGLGNLFIGKITLYRILTSSIISFIIITIFMGFKSIIVIGAIIILSVLYKRYMNSKIGGMTGDTLGSGNEIAEIISILIIVAMRRYTLI